MAAVHDSSVRMKSQQPNCNILNQDLGNIAFDGQEKFL